MSKPDAKTLDAMRRYIAERRRHRRFMLGFLALGFAFVGVVDLLDMIEDRFSVQTPSGIHYLLSIPVVLIFAGAFVCFGVVAFTMLSLFIMQFSLFPYCCPRCDKWFAFSGWSWFTDRCKHCGLDLGPAATAAEKPIPEKPELFSSTAGLWDRELDGHP